MSRTIIQLFLAAGQHLPTRETLESIINAHEEAITRMLNIRGGSIKVADAEFYLRWFEE
jgi:hypothetical protein